MLYLTNAIPNSFLTAWASTRVKKITPEQAFEMLTDANPYQDYDDELIPRQFKKWVMSIVGHDTAAAKLSQVFTELNGNYGFKPILFEVPVNRQSVQLKDDDSVIAAIIQTPYRLPEGELWSPEQLAEMPIEFLYIYNGRVEDEDHQWRFEMTQFA